MTVLQGHMTVHLALTTVLMAALQDRMIVQNRILKKINLHLRKSVQGLFVDLSHK